MDKTGLRERTLSRNASTWVTLDWGGLLQPLASQQEDLDTLGRNRVENFLAIGDEAWNIKETQRDRTIELNQAEVDQDVALAEAKAVTGRAKIAIEHVVDEYTLAAKVYDAQVKGLIMGAKEYAALVEREQLANEESRASLAVDKEGVRLEKVKGDIYLEVVQQAQAGADLARTDLAIDKEGVRRTKIQSEIYQETVQQAQAGVDLARMDLAVNKEGVHQTKIQSEIYQETVQQAQAGTDLAKVDLAVDKEALRLFKVQTDIYLETIQQKQVEADLAKSQVEVAKALVRATLSEIEAGKAEVELIETEVQKFMAEAEKATLKADVATIYAEILTKKLSEIKLDVGRQEIQTGFSYLQAKLDDMLTIWDSRTQTEVIKKESETGIQNELALNLVAQKAEEDLRIQEVDNLREVFKHEVAETKDNIELDGQQREGLVRAQKNLNDARRDYAVSQMAKKTWAQILENTAHKYAYLNQVRQSTEIKRITETIRK